MKQWKCFLFMVKEKLFNMTNINNLKKIANNIKKDIITTSLLVGGLLFIVAIFLFIPAYSIFVLMENTLSFDDIIGFVWIFYMVTITLSMLCINVYRWFKYIWEKCKDPYYNPYTY